MKQDQLIEMFLYPLRKKKNEAGVMNAHATVKHVLSSDDASIAEIAEQLGESHPVISRRLDLANGLLNLEGRGVRTIKQAYTRFLEKEIGLLYKYMYVREDDIYAERKRKENQCARQGVCYFTEFHGG